MSDKVHKSAAKHIRVGFLVCAVAMAAFLMVPHEMLGQNGNWILGAACTLGFGSIVFTMRAVFFAPMDEVKVPAEITGAAMSLASLVIYLPNAFAYVMYGSFLDRYPGMTGFLHCFQRHDRMGRDRTFRFHISDPPHQKAPDFQYRQLITGGFFIC